LGEVVELGGYTLLPIDPNKVLTGALDKLDYVLVLGWNKDGSMWSASSEGKMAEAVYIATRFIHKEMAGEFGGR
jgi:hypothetical protein